MYVMLVNYRYKENMLDKKYIAGKKRKKEEKEYSGLDVDLTIADFNGVLMRPFKCSFDGPLPTRESRGYQLETHWAIEANGNTKRNHAISAAI